MRYKFCADNNITNRQIQCFHNNKPWVTSNLKSLLNQKKKAFGEGDRETTKTLQKELKVKIKNGKQAYKHKLEQQLQQDGVRQAWAGMKKITGMEGKGGQLPDGDKDLADELNLFFNRFDSPPPPCLPPVDHAPKPTLSPHPPSITIHPLQVWSELNKLKQGKAPGPDGICPRLLKTCSTQLCEILTHLFNLSLRLQRVPTLWKTSCLVPVPKKKQPRDPNDYRPIALTSHIMKTLERLVLTDIRPRTSKFMDPLQFAYQPNIGVDDALIYMLQRTHAHLDTADANVRIMFFDFSSAFNTIQPELLGEK